MSAERSHRIAGGAGVRLHVVETGNPNGRPILFVHGISQCWLSWSRQTSSDLADDFRLVAMDLRGHGLSDRPREGYTDSGLWADDVNAIIRGLALDRPILCGSSYGPLVMLDYIRHYGDAGLGALNFVGGVTQLGTADSAAVLTPEFLSLVPGLFATDAEESVRSLDSLVGLCFARPPAAGDRYRMLGWCVSVSPAVRQAMLSRSLDNDDLLPNIRTPVLITHGAEDAVVRPAAADRHKAGIAHAQVRIMPNAGHAPFWDDAPAFNRELREFAEGL